MRLQRASIFSGTLKYTPIGLAFLTLSFTVVSLFNPINPSNADDLTATSGASTYSASISSSNGAEIIVDPTSEQKIFTGKNEISYTNSCPYGFTIILSSSSEETALTRTGSDSLTKTIPSIDTGTTLLDNTWGFTTSSSENAFSPIPPLASPVVLLETSAATNVPTTLTVTYGLKTDNEMPSGVYTNDIVYTVMVKPQCMGYTLKWDLDGGDDKANSYEETHVDYGTTFDLSGYVPVKEGYTFAGWQTADTSFIDLTDVTAVDVNPNNSDVVTMKAVWAKTLHQMSTMQEMTSLSCRLTTTPNVAATTFDWDGSHRGDKNYVPRKSLKDTRDNNYYLVSKLADGNCWMSQNLALELSDTEEIEASNNDGTTMMVTPGNSTQQGTSEIWEQYDDVWRSYHPKDSVSYLQGGTKVASTPTGSGVEYDWEKTGNYYNWHAATAGTGLSVMSTPDASASICPKGWRLPTDNSSTAAQRQYGYLLKSVYNLSGTAGSTKMLQAPLNFNMAGYYKYDTGEVVVAGSYGNYMMGTSRNNVIAVRLSFTSSDVNPYTESTKGQGFTVRCIAI